MKNKAKHIIKSSLTLLLLLFVLPGCIPGDGTASSVYPAGFLWGIWHGWLAPISLIIGFFNKEIRIYETYNTGWRYDFGFYIAIIAGFGGLSLFRFRKRKNK